MYKFKNKQETLSNLLIQAEPQTNNLAKRILTRHYNLTGTVQSISELTPDALDINIYVYSCLIDQQQQISNITSQCTNTRMPNSIIYSSKKGNLMLKEILDIAKYAISIADMLGFNVGQVSSAITGLKVINRIYSGEKISAKDISLMIEIIAECQKHYAKDEIEKAEITISSTAFSLAIDYLTTEKTRGNINGQAKTW